ncbi:hypothetical protein [Shewanella sp. Isolate8]|uniref:hypothetical protein n=1 Tax=Shewanella sp. Isolate8 TaxID=2908529 RepID=UPI001EFE8123|nr:hypothetical protein [Shewanella sp. Isolate8]MCG9746419.1 hypothetical protein [Shewanella sp. Isolate8]
MFEKNYKLLVQEGHLTMSSLLGGLNSIRNANIDDAHRGLFYSGLFELATGFERLMKIVLLLDHKINNHFKNPTNNQLKDYGHNILELYSSCHNLAKSYGLESKMEPNEVQNEMLAVLSKFAKGSRYYNLDELTSNNKNEDPINLWLSVIQYHIWGLRSDVREKIQMEALSINNVDQWQQNINGEWITSCEFYYLLKATEKASYHVIWSIISLLRPFYSLLREQVYTLHEMYSDSTSGDKEEIPYLYEFFVFFLKSKHSVLRKKQWALGA